MCATNLCWDVPVVWVNQSMFFLLLNNIHICLVIRKICREKIIILLILIKKQSVVCKCCAQFKGTLIFLSFVLFCQIDYTKPCYKYFVLELECNQQFTINSRKVFLNQYLKLAWLMKDAALYFYRGRLGVVLQDLQDRQIL